MADGHALLLESFRQHLDRFPDLLAELDEAESLRLGREAAEAVIGPLIWRALLGEDRLDTTQAARLLGISRQAIHKRVQNHTLLGVPGRGTTWFPAWQFAIENAEVRPVTAALLAAWTDAGDGAGPDPHDVLAWAKTPQPELEDQTPEDWILAGKDDESVLAAARAAARALAA